MKSSQNFLRTILKTSGNKMDYTLFVNFIDSIFSKIANILTVHVVIMFLYTFHICVEIR